MAVLGKAEEAEEEDLFSRLDIAGITGRNGGPEDEDPEMGGAGGGGKKGRR